MDESWISTVAPSLTTIALLAFFIIVNDVLKTVNSVSLSVKIASFIVVVDDDGDGDDPRFVPMYSC
jgi:hypothetical protein